jgi:hypothetical protein
MYSAVQEETVARAIACHQTTLKMHEMAVAGVVVEERKRKGIEWIA